MIMIIYHTYDTPWYDTRVFYRCTGNDSTQYNIIKVARRFITHTLHGILRYIFKEEEEEVEEEVP